MGVYRKKPVTIEAIRLEKGMDVSSPDWFVEAVFKNKVILHGFGKFTRDVLYASVDSMDGISMGKEGDYLIRGIAGELYCCRADVFGLTYEEVTE